MVFQIRTKEDAEKFVELLDERVEDVEIPEFETEFCFEDSRLSMATPGSTCIKKVKEDVYFMSSGQNWSDQDWSICSSDIVFDNRKDINQAIRNGVNLYYVEIFEKHDNPVAERTRNGTGKFLDEKNPKKNVMKVTDQEKKRILDNRELPVNIDMNQVNKDNIATCLVCGEVGIITRILSKELFEYYCKTCDSFNKCETDYPIEIK